LILTGRKTPPGANIFSLYFAFGASPGLLVTAPD